MGQRESECAIGGVGIKGERVAMPFGGQNYVSYYLLLRCFESYDIENSVGCAGHIKPCLYEITNGVNEKPIGKCTIVTCSHGISKMAIILSLCRVAFFPLVCHDSASVKNIQKCGVFQQYKEIMESGTNLTIFQGMSLICCKNI